MDILVRPASASLMVKGSRFLSELLICSSQSEARALIKLQKQKYKDATHVVHAFVTGPGAEITGMSDDGEPPGTAGRPVLDVLLGRGCTGTMLTVTRWFGGTLLGTGGLVKAYGDAAKLVISSADAACSFEELVEKKTFAFTADYALYEKLKRLMCRYHLYDVAEQFGSGVHVTGSVRAAEFSCLADEICEISAGRILLQQLADR